jgi:hypothetical protein
LYEYRLASNLYVAIGLFQIITDNQPLKTNEHEGERRRVDCHWLDKGDDVAGGAAKRKPAQPQHADDLK